MLFPKRGRQNHFNGIADGMQSNIDVWLSGAVIMTVEANPQHRLLHPETLQSVPITYP